MNSWLNIPDGALVEIFCGNCIFGSSEGPSGDIKNVKPLTLTKGAGTITMFLGMKELYKPKGDIDHIKNATVAFFLVDGGQYWSEVLASRIISRDSRVRLL